MVGVWDVGEAGKRTPLENGAALVEMALVMPLLLLLLIGTVEFGWLFAQNLEVRHAAREGARLIAVNFPEGPPPNSGARTAANSGGVVSEVCGRMLTVTSAAVSLTSAGAVGDDATIRVEASSSSLSGLLDWAIPAAHTLTSEVQIVLEQDATWADTTNEAC